MVPKNQVGVAILISNKTDFQPKVIKKEQKGHFTQQRKILSRVTLNPKHLCSKYKSNHIHNRNSTKAHSIFYTTHNNSGRLQHLILSNGQIMDAETEDRHGKTNRSYGQNRFNRHLKIYLLFSISWHLLQNLPYCWTQNRP